MLKSTRCREEEEDSLFTVKRRRRIIMNDVIIGLPSDIWLDIFRRMPPADLLSLKAVCKTFHQLISSDWFVGMHLKDLPEYPEPAAAFIVSTDPTDSNLIYNPEKGTIGVCRRDESRFDYLCTHHAIGSPRCHRVIDSYLGLLLVRVCDRLLLCNPITRSHLFLPSISGFSLDFSCWKIAYDDVSELYKVFGLKIRKNKVSLYVFDVHTDGKSHLPARKTTTTVEVGFNRIVMYDLIKQSVLVNGNVYWLIIAKDRKPRWGCIVSANVTTEEVKTRICSPHEYPRYSDTNFFAANGTFYFNKNGYPYYSLSLWVLEGVESGNPHPIWTCKHECIRTNSITGPHFHIRALGMFRNKLLVVILLSGQYYQYDLSREDFDKVILAKGDVIKPELIGDDTKCEMSMGPIDIATRVPVGCIPSAIL